MLMARRASKAFNGFASLSFLDLEPGTRPRRGLLSQPVAFTDQKLCRWLIPSPLISLAMFVWPGCLPGSRGKQLGAGEDLPGSGAVLLHGHVMSAASRTRARMVSIVIVKHVSIAEVLLRVMKFPVGFASESSAT